MKKLERNRFFHMNKNKIQFQKGLSLIEFHNLYGTEEQCYQELFKLRWPTGFTCPKCGYGKGGWLRTRGVYQCYHCAHQASVTSGTIFHATKLPLTVWFLCMYLMTQNKNGVSALELRRQLGISYNAAWRMKQKLMQVMLERNSKRKLQGNILMDDAYLGGERSGGKRGRGASGKTPFVIALETKEDQPIYIKLNRVSSFSRKELEIWSGKCLEPGSTVVSDGCRCFSSVAQAGCSHISIRTGSGKKAVMNPIFTWLNTILGNVKNSLCGTYHSFRQKHAPRYLAEFQYRFNRRFNLGSMIPNLIYSAAHTLPRPDHFLTLSENWW